MEASQMPGGPLQLSNADNWRREAGLACELKIKILKLKSMFANESPTRSSAHTVVDAFPLHTSDDSVCTRMVARQIRLRLYAENRFLVHTALFEMPLVLCISIFFMFMIC
jgi:hypothetical protein